jgi:hypothetical protein
MNKLSRKYGSGKLGKIGDRPLFCDSGFCVSGFVEKPDAAAVVMLDAGWCDVGSWTALWEISPKDDQGNACKGDVLALDTRNSLKRKDLMKIRITEEIWKEGNMYVSYCPELDVAS